MRIFTDRWAAGQMLFRYLVEQATKKLDERDTLVAGICTRADVEKRQAYVRRRHREMFAQFPAKTPLRPRLVETLERDGYVIEKLIFESRPQFYVPANLYLPRGREFPVPAILKTCGHSPNGKAYDVYQHLCIGFARKGYAVLTFDPIGQGERGPYQDMTTGNEHDTTGRQCFLTGNHLSAFMMWDCIRALDYLCSRDEVDEHRIGITGCSGGGTLLAHILAVESRISVAMPVCFITTERKRFEELYGPMRDVGDAEQIPLGMVKYGIEHADLLLPFAPSPLQIGAAEKDFFSITGARETCRELKRMYRILGAEEQLDITEAPTAHGYSKELREPAYEWMNRWLGMPEETGAEPEIATEPEENLRCTETGLVSASLGGETVFSLNKAFAESVMPRRKKTADLSAYIRYRTAIQKKMIALTGYAREDSDLNIETFGRLDTDYGFIEKLTYTSEPGITVPALAFVPKAAGPHPAVISVHEAGKTANQAEIEDLARNGSFVLAVDPRGIGETAGKYYEDLCHAAFALGRTVFGMQLLDVIRAVDYLETRGDMDTSRIACAGHGAAGLLAMHAAALDDRLSEVTSRGALISYRSLLAEPTYNHGVEVLVPHVLAHYDLPDIAALVAPRPLNLLGLVDHLKKEVGTGAATREYAWTASIYRLFGCSTQLTIARSSR